TLFAQDNKDATASILLKLKPYAQMNENQVLAIMRLVANSVEGLNPEQVAVVDTNGNILSENVLDNSTPTIARLTANQLEIKDHFENNLAKSIQTMLEKPFGYGGVVVRVSADLNFDEVERRSQIFGDNVVRSESSLEETSSGTTPNGGVVDPGGAPVGLNDATSEYERNENIRNYEVDVVEEYIKTSPGAVKHLSVSVIVDTGEELELNPARREMVANLVASAAGVRLDRNDTVEVIGMPFNTSAFDDMNARMDEYQQQQFMRQLITYGLGLVVILAVLGVSVRTIRKAQRSNKQIKQFEEVVEQQIELTPEEKEKNQMKKQIEGLAKEKPSEVAHLLKTWLAEDSR
ncbi:MAG: flagellar basal-body MS-ring/collar protein FliF, partial [Bacillota bacterium]|nr:flagellar basal-body MS-ring/collar protein FliF [Bacillota bacterium]